MPAYGAAVDEVFKGVLVREARQDCEGISVSITAEPTTFHEWLFHATKHGSVSVIDIMDDVADYGERLPAFMPNNGITCQEMLERLELKGMAKRNEPRGSLWRWCEAKAKEPEARQAEVF